MSQNHEIFDVHVLEEYGQMYNKYTASVSNHVARRGAQTMPLLMMQDDDARWT